MKPDRHDANTQARDRRYPPGVLQVLPSVCDKVAERRLRRDDSKAQRSLRKTLVLEVPLTEASAKVRQGDPIDDPEDTAGPWWAGVIPVETRFGTPYPAADYTGDRPVPDAYLGLE